MLNIAGAQQLFNHGQQKSVEEDSSQPSVRNITHQGSPWRGEAAWLCIWPFGCSPLLSRHHVQLIPFLHHEVNITTAFDKPK
ncbi:hypothetical protein FocnCong_v001387 [Fusarium oxysporum f. sp. conglutinans]|nr:hypothetical protein FocnCong_v001387 [Fusarium oxysporum f. sp. conglutinans]